MREHNAQGVCMYKKHNLLLCLIQCQAPMGTLFHSIQDYSTHPCPLPKKPLFPGDLSQSQDDVSRRHQALGQGYCCQGCSTVSICWVLLQLVCSHQWKRSLRVIPGVLSVLLLLVSPSLLPHSSGGWAPDAAPVWRWSAQLPRETMQPFPLFLCHVESREPQKPLQALPRKGYKNPSVLGFLNDMEFL